ncbi:MAG TPA: dual specificity protein phosphatase 23 [Thermomicrobiales bacterium]
MPLFNFSWLIEGELAGSARPLGGIGLATLNRRGVRVVISLTEKPPSASSLRRAGLVGIHLPIADFTAPTLAQIAVAVSAIDDFRARGLPVAVHCAAGRGRTGTLLAAYLVSQGMAAEAAIGQVRAQRPGSIETPEQEEVVREYARQRE